MRLRGDFISGVFVPVADGAADGEITRLSPRDLDEVVARVPYRFSAVGEAVAS